MPRCTSFASPPIFDEAMIPKNTVIDPEQITILRRELVRQCVATFCWHPAGATRHRQSPGGREGDSELPTWSKPPSPPPSRSDFCHPITSISVFQNLRREISRPDILRAGIRAHCTVFTRIRCIFGRLKTGGRIKSVLRDPIGNPGVLRGINYWGTRPLPEGFAPTEDFRRGGMSAGYPLFWGTYSPVRLL